MSNRITTKKAREIPPNILHRKSTVSRSISLPDAFPQPIESRVPTTPAAISIHINGQNIPGLSDIDLSFQPLLISTIYLRVPMYFGIRQSAVNVNFD
jgi:hypothetical protein